jgi:hypothetical protein
VLSAALTAAAQLGHGPPRQQRNQEQSPPVRDSGQIRIGQQVVGPNATVQIFPCQDAGFGAKREQRKQDAAIAD